MLASHEKSIVGILLAAGASRRFGTNKLLTKLDNNIPVIVQSATKLTSVCTTTLVVIHRNSVEIQTLLANLPIEIIVNDNASDGMASSIVSAVTASSKANAWMLALGDMPFIQQATYQLVYQSLNQGAELVAPTYGSQRGHPVGISKDFLPLLLQLQGDYGAKSILDEYRTELVCLDCNDSGILRDIDHPSDVIVR